jgi:DNA-binding NtrC family response regulator
VRASRSLTAPDGTQGLDIVAKKRPDAVVTDMRMPGISGMRTAREDPRDRRRTARRLMTAFGTIETAVKAMKLGAFDYLTKPFEGDELIITVKRAVEHAGLCARTRCCDERDARRPGSTGTGGRRVRSPSARGSIA